MIRGVIKSDGQKLTVSAPQSLFGIERSLKGEEFARVVEYLKGETLQDLQDAINQNFTAAQLASPESFDLAYDGLKKIGEFGEITKI